VAASNRSLPAEVNAGRFRADLYYRLAVLEVTLPPLRARLDDIPLLVDHLLGELGASPAAGERLRAAAFLASLARYNWPGNVRELRNHLGRCLVLEETPLPGSTAPPLDGVDVSLPLRTARERWLHAFERAYLGKLLEVHGDNVSAAARAAGVDRTYLHRVLSRLGLR
jgi:two-component system, NtrC family, response regulator GlrR